MNSKTIKSLAYAAGADICGIAPAERFKAAPAGFRPTDIYPGCQSVLVFAKQIPGDVLKAESCVPYTQVNNIATRMVDDISYQISIALQKKQIGSVMIPTDDPYESWDAANLRGQAILSLRHAGYLAGLGYLGKNTLLITPAFGSMQQIGAVLLDIALEADEMIERQCPEQCGLCIKSCPVQALDGKSTNQKLCRPMSMFTNAKGYTLKKCYVCRKVCPMNTAQ